MAPAPKTRNRFIPCLRKTFSCGSFFPMLMMRNSGRQLRWLLAIGKTAGGDGFSPRDGYSVPGQESDGLRRSARRSKAEFQRRLFPSLRKTFAITRFHLGM